MEAEAANEAPTEAVILMDTETNDLDNPEVIEFAMLLIERAASENRFFALRDPLQERFHFLNQRYKPERPISLGALATHHILDDDLEDEPPVSEFVIAQDVAYVIGHNIDFDMKAARPAHQPRRICTLAMARLTWPDLDSHSLGALMYHVKGRNYKTREALQSAHSARADVNFAFVILCEILRLNPLIRTWRDLWLFSEDARLPRKMTFGKHKGMLITELPSGYVRWMHGANKGLEDDPDMYYACLACEKFRDHSRDR